jgi:hypothetical protein
MHLNPVTPLGIVHPIKTGRLFGVHRCEGMVRRQRIIIERSVIGRLRIRPMLLLHFPLLTLDLSSSEEEESFASSFDDEEDISCPFGFLVFNFFLSLAIFHSSLSTFNSEASWSALDPFEVEGFMPFPSPLGGGTSLDPAAFVDGSPSSISLTLGIFSPSG